MRDAYDTTLILWPATPLPARVVEELRGIEVELIGQQAALGWLTAHRTEDEQLLLEITREHPHGLTDLEAVLATLRLSDIAYVAWDVKKREVAGTCRVYNPDSRMEREFTVMADGEPVLTASDLSEFEHYGTAEALLDEIRAWLRLPIPENLSDATAFTIVVEPEDTGDEGRS